jgi:hypothetical protein
MRSELGVTTRHAANRPLPVSWMLCYFSCPLRSESSTHGAEISFDVCSWSGRSCCACRLRQPQPAWGFCRQQRWCFCSRARTVGSRGMQCTARPVCGGAKQHGCGGGIRPHPFGRPNGAHFATWADDHEGIRCAANQPGGGFQRPHPGRALRLKTLPATARTLEGAMANCAGE